MRSARLHGDEILCGWIPLSQLPVVRSQRFQNCGVVVGVAEQRLDLLDLKGRLLRPDFTDGLLQVVLGLGSGQEDDAVEVPEREQGQDWPRLH